MTMKRERKRTAFAAVMIVLLAFCLVCVAPVSAEELTCGKTVHTHVDGCYPSYLSCISAHEHNEKCYKKRTCSHSWPYLRCGDSCYTQTTDPSCGKEEHYHGDSCYEKSTIPNCGSSAHEHETSCYKYTVAFNSNGGTSVQDQTVQGTEKATVPSSPTKDGYSFSSWQLNGVDYNFDTAVTADITLTAKWIETTYTVTVNLENAVYTQYTSDDKKTTVTITPNSGFFVESVSVDDTVVPDVTYSDCKATIVCDTSAANHEVTASIKKAELTPVQNPTIEAGSATSEAVIKAVFGGNGLPNGFDSSELTVEFLAGTIDYYLGSYGIWFSPDTTVNVDSVANYVYNILNIPESLLSRDTISKYIFDEKLLHDFGTQGTEKVRFSYAGGDKYPSMTYEGQISVSEIETQVILKSDVSVDYEASGAEILSAVFESVKAGDTPVADSSKVDCTVGNIDNGERKVTVTYSGDGAYKASSAETTVKVTATVTWSVDDEKKEDKVQIGTTPSYGETPTKAATAQYTYTFAGWDKEIVAVTGDVTYTAQYTSNLRYYTITWNDEGGSQLKTDTVAYGTKPSYGESVPTKTETDQYTYTFKEWSPEIVPVTGAATYTATYTSTVNKYTIKFVNDDGDELESYEVEYGANPKYIGANPTKPGDTEGMYNFAGWSTDGTAVLSVLPEVTGTATYKAVYTEKTVYTVTFKIDGETDHTVNVIDGQSVEKYAPTKECYTLSEWMLNGDDYDFSTAVTEALTLTANWELISYKVIISGVENANVDIKKDDGTPVTSGELVSIENATTITITPETGYVVKSVMVNGISADVAFDDCAATFTLSNPDTDSYIVTVVVEKAEQILAPESNNGNGASPTVTLDGSKVTEQNLIDAVYTEADKANLPSDFNADNVKVEYLAFSAEIDLTSIGYGKIPVEWWVAPGTDLSTDALVDYVMNMLAQRPQVSAYSMDDLTDSLSGIISPDIIKEALTTVIEKLLADNKPHEFGKQETETVRFTYSNEQLGTVTYTTKVTTTDTRIPTNVVLRNEIQTIYYGETKEQILTSVFESVNNANDNTIVTNNAGYVTLEIDNLNAGEHTVTVKYAGDNTYQPSEATTTITIEKIDAVLTVTDQTAKYDGNGISASDLIYSDADRVEIVAGITTGDETYANIVAHINLPEIIDTSSISDSTIKTFVENALETVNENFNDEMTVEEFKTALENVLNLIEENAYLSDSQYLNTDAIKVLYQILDELSQVEGVGTLTISVTVGKDITVYNAGVYVVAGIITDANYNTDAEIGYVIITPDGQKAELGWVVEDENGIITIDALKNGYNLDAKVVNVAEGTVEEAETHLNELFLGVYTDGESVDFIITKDSSELTFGAYSEIAFIADFGNQMYYAEPIAREFVVLPDTVKIEFIDETGAVNADRLFTYDGTYHLMQAKAYYRDTGAEITDAPITYIYTGLQSNGVPYVSESAPVDAGVYTVTAICIIKDDEGTITHAGVGTGALVIKPAQPTIIVADTTVKYGEPYAVSGQITSTGLNDESLKQIEIVTGIAAGDHASTDAGIVTHIRIPSLLAPELTESEYLKEFINQIAGEEISIPESATVTKTVTVGEFKEALNEVLPTVESLTEAGVTDEYLIEAVTKLQTVLNDESVTDTQSVTISVHYGEDEIEVTDAGLYLVIGVVADSNYLPASDIGYLLITPDGEKVTLDWIEEDENGIITIGSLENRDFGAKIAGGAESAAANIKTVFIGIDANGNFVTTSNPADLTFGAYTEIAFIADFGNQMYYADPIVREFIITSDLVELKFIDQNENNARIVQYTGSPVAMDAVAYKRGTGEVLEADISYIYTGFDAAGNLYRSTSAPTELGIYSVIATCTVTGDAGITHFGAAVGTLAIIPDVVKLNIEDKEVTYDGQPHLEEISDAVTANTIYVVVDEQGIANVIVPDGWYSGETTTVTVDAITEYINTIVGSQQTAVAEVDYEALAAEIDVDEISAALKNYLEAYNEEDITDYSAELIMILAGAQAVDLEALNSALSEMLGEYSSEDLTAFTAELQAKLAEYGVDVTEFSAALNSALAEIQTEYQNIDTAEFYAKLAEKLAEYNNEDIPDLSAKLKEYLAAHQIENLDDLTGKLDRYLGAYQTNAGEKVSEIIDQIKSEAGITAVIINGAKPTEVGEYDIIVVAIDDSSRKVSVGNAKLTIVAEETYTVTFDSNGGTNVEQQTLTSGGLVTEPTAPTKDGFTFAGWYSDIELTTAWNFETDTVTADITLYAKWTVTGSGSEPVTYTVTFDMNGHGTAIASQTINEGEKATEPAAPVADGYTFGGWFTNAGCTTAYDFNSAVTSHITLYAKWTANSVEPTTYTITWKNWDGTVLETDENVEAGTKPEYNGATPTRAADSQYTYTFKAWSPDVVAVTGNAEYTATYTATAINTGGDKPSGGGGGGYVPPTVVTPSTPTVTPDWPEAGEITFQTEITSGGELTIKCPYYGTHAVEDDIKITGVTLPAGLVGDVSFIPISEYPAPAGKESQTQMVFDINIPDYEKGKPAVVKFTMTVDRLTEDGKTAADVALWHFDVDTWEWTKLVTSYTIENGIVNFEAITYDFSPFAIVYEDETVDQPEEPSDEPEEPKTPAPVLAVLAGLGAAVVLRRK